MDACPHENGDSKRQGKRTVTIKISNSRILSAQSWRQDNHPEELISDKFQDQKLDYVHNNPVEAGLVDNAEDYRYSSARDYAGGKGLLVIVFVSLYSRQKYRVTDPTFHQKITSFYADDNRRRMSIIEVG